jgi:cytochrome c-type biogenesis protein CcmF
MVSDYGFFLLLLCTITSIYGAVAALFSGWFRHRRLYYSAKVAALSSTLMVWTAAIILWYLLFARDYSVAYVAKNSSNDLPVFYTFTAFWSALEGSHLLWTLLLATFSGIVHLAAAKDNEHLMPYVSTTLQTIVAWMFYLAVTASNPFALQFPAAENGSGMNVLLQNPYMAIHPPSLFIGYTALAIPFAYAVAALCYGDITQGWLKTVRRWALFAWSILTLGIFLGGRWAYVVLGWSGYWAWDPVENSSLVPWLFATALLHSLVVHERVGQLKRVSLITAFFAFFFSYFGTFITRSGIIGSVHAFAQSAVGTHYLIYLAVLMVAALLLFRLRSASILPGEKNKEWGFSKESFLLLGQFLLLTFAVIIFIGTVYPIVSEAITGVRFNIQAPYFNSFAPYLGLGFILTVTIGNALRFRSGSFAGGKRILLISLLWAIPFAVGLIYWGEIWRSHGVALAMQGIGSYLCAWSAICLSVGLWQKIRTYPDGVSAYCRHHLRVVGSYVAHLGLVVAIFGFLGNYRGINHTVSLKKGEATSIYGFTLVSQGITTGERDNVQLYQAPFTVQRNNVDLGTVTPARTKYPTHAELLHEVGLLGNFWQDLYVVLADFEEGEQGMVTVQIHINPAVRIVWQSAFLLVGGGLLALLGSWSNRPRRRQRRRAALHTSQEGAS